MSKKEVFEQCDSNGKFDEFSKVYDRLYQNEKAIAWLKFKLESRSLKITDPRALVTSQRILIFGDKNGSRVLEKELYVGGLDKIELGNESRRYYDIRLDESLVLGKIPKDIAENVYEKLDIKSAPTEQEIKDSMDIKQWEYKRIQVQGQNIDSADERIKDLGTRGWELVSVIPTSGILGRMTESGGTDYVHLYFKRPASGQK
ncbi:DUF4177 domain-containing protein [Candidatus Bipolaricaulota bacterium]|nr:DUF4177 domain-containing protein [Candidatus Bipolaricaulota bacterium]